MLCANIIVPVMYIVIKKFKQKTYIRLYAARGRFRNDWEYKQDKLANLL